MNKYERAAEVRERGFLGNITDNLVSGKGSITGSIGRGISDTFKAKATGVKEKFDPLNIAKKMTGGVGVGILGRMMGRSKSDMSYFSNKGKGDGLLARAFSSMRPKGKLGGVDTALYANISDGSRNGLKKNDSLANVGAKLYNVMKTSYDIKKLEKELDKNFSAEHAAEDARRHDELIDAIEKSKKKVPEPKKVKKEVEKQVKKAEVPAAPPAPGKVPEMKAPTAAKPPTGKAPVVAKPTAKPAEAPVAKAPTAKPAGAEKPSAAPKVEPVKPKVEPAKAPAPAPTVTASKVVAVATATTAALAGKEAIAANISKYESRGAGDYNAYNKGTKKIEDKNGKTKEVMIPSDVPIDFSKMSISEFLRRGELDREDPDRLFAVGRYQIIPNTMKELVKKLKLDPNTTQLDKDTQDKLFANGLVGIVRKKVNAYIKGESDDRDAAILELAQEFASVGIPYDMTINGKHLKRGESYYSGKGGNKAHNSPDEVGKALDIDRSKNLKTASTAAPDNVISTGTKLSDSSVANASAKEQTKGRLTVISDSTTTAIVGSTGKPVTLTNPTPRDRPAHQQ